MRRIVMFNRVTADGYFAAPDGQLDWVVPDDEMDGAAVEAMPEADTILLGRKTYDMFESFWPKVLDNPNVSDPHVPQRTSPALREMAIWINDATKLLFSKTRKNATWKNTRVLSDLDPREIENLKRQPGKDMMIFGSGSIVSRLTQHGLIDEYQFIVNPTLIGSGRLLFSDVSKRSKLKLLEARAYPSGNVMLRYAPSK